MGAQGAKVTEIIQRAHSRGWEASSTGAILGQVTVIARDPDGGATHCFTVDEKGKVLDMPMVVSEALGYG